LTDETEVRKYEKIYKGKKQRLFHSLPRECSSGSLAGINPPCTKYIWQFGQVSRIDGKGKKNKGNE
jgi:hypothetical protein